MGDPYHLKRAELKKHRVAVFSSNYTLYGDMSRRVMQTLAAFTPELEIYSIEPIAKRWRFEALGGVLRLGGRHFR